MYDMYLSSYVTIKLNSFLFIWFNLTLPRYFLITINTIHHVTNKTLFRECKQIWYRKWSCTFELWSANIMRPWMTKHILTRLRLNDIKHCKGWYYKLMSNGWWGGGSGWIRILPRPLLFHVSCVPSRTQHKQDQTIHLLWMLSNPLTKQ